MERQKIIWVIFSVGFVITALVITGYFLTRQEGGSDTSMEIASRSIEIPGNADATGSAGTVDTRDAINNRIELAPPPDEETSGSFEVPDNAASRESAAEKSSIETGAEYYGKETAEKETASGSATYHNSGTSSAAEQKPAASRTPASYTAPKTETVVNYWIQLASYPKKSTAEMNQQELTEKGLSTTMFTTVVDGETWYRLRYGPFSSQSEADKFLAWIKNLSGYEGSYRTEVYVTR